MNDRYLKFANRPLGKKVLRTLGLPTPLPLQRFRVNEPVVSGTVLVGGTADSRLIRQTAAVMQSIGAQTLAHQGLPDWIKIVNDQGLITGRWNPTGDTGKAEKVKALIFDATGIKDSTQTDSLYDFFHDTARSLLTCGRLIVLATPPEECSTPKEATIQRAMEGLTRSLGKEIKHGATTQLIYVSEGAESNMESTLRFLLSPRSAYVSGQVIRISKTTGEQQIPENWNESLASKKVLVTGASRGIGLAIAQTLARESADLILLDIPSLETELSNTAIELKARHLALDISAEKTPAALVAAAQADGGWDIVVHNAGITRDKKIANMKNDLWQQVVDINLSSQERINDALLSTEALNRNGRIVSVSSISGIAGNIGQTNYALSKAGVIGMVQSMAPVCANRGITINAVAPGFIETKMTAKLPFGIREAGRRLNSLNQGGQAVDVAEAIIWLASPASSGLNGNTVRVCGQSLLGA